MQHRFFTCEERSRSMKHIKETFTKVRPWKENLSRHCTSHIRDSHTKHTRLSLQMNKNGIYKAMGEFDIFINYIEKYLTMKRRN